MSTATGTHSLEAQRALLESTKPQRVPPPTGVHFDLPSEKVLWKQLTAARPKADWREMDLVMLAKIVRLETQINEQQDALDREGYLSEGPKGGTFANPRCGILHQMQTRQLGIMRALALTVIHSIGTASPNAKKAEATKKKITEAPGSANRMGLLASRFGK